ncbi:cupin domain-containing protein [Candidatus Roizmanbacteria bacterium]|nr:cupin domain-containing protein [Candidatus Roizmanbacteria bacterium]
MTGFVTNIEEKTQENSHFRQVIFTSQHNQLVLMHLQPSEDIGMEVHAYTDQFLRIESGEGKVIMNGEETMIQDGSAIVVPAGTQHNVINTSADHPLKLYTIYSPPHHKDGTVHHTKQDALNDTEDHL